VHVEEALLMPGKKNDSAADASAAGAASGCEVKVGGWVQGTAKKFQGAFKWKQEREGGSKGLDGKAGPSWVCNRRVGLMALAVLLLLVLGGIAAGVVYLKKVKEQEKENGEHRWVGWTALNLRTCPCHMGDDNMHFCYILV
jgi:hypothetical protein